MTSAPDRATASRAGVGRELLVFCGAAALALLIVSFGAVVASRSVARSQALTDAERQTSRMANLVVGPLLHDALDGDASGFQELTKAIDLRMRDGYLRQVTVWDHNGRVVFANDPAEIGRVVPTPPEVAEAIDHRVISADFADAPETTTLAELELEDGFVEVYAPFDSPAEASMAFEAYYDYARVDETANSLMWQLIPLVLVPLVALMAIQIPIATSMARRIRRHDTERSELAVRGLAASERERVRIAADLHDGPIQDLAGMSYALGAVALSVPEHNQALMTRLQFTVQRSIESLRQLMVDLYPPDLSVAQLPRSLSALADPLRSRNICVEFDIGPLPAMNADVVTTLYRVAHEALANVAEHSEASAVTVTLNAGPVLDDPEGSGLAVAGAVSRAASHVGRNTRGGVRQDLRHANGSLTVRTPTDGRIELAGLAGRTCVRLQIRDNGIGFEPERIDRRAEGHLGLRLLTSRVEHMGGTLTVATRPGGGTSVVAVLPADGFAAD